MRAVGESDDGQFTITIGERSATGLRRKADLTFPEGYGEGVREVFTEEVTSEI